MADEFERIMAFFDLGSEEKEKRLQEVFEDALAYFERFKHVIERGEPEEKKKIIERIVMMRKRIEEETKRICEKTKMSEEELLQFSNDPKNFSKPQWEMIENAKVDLDKGVEEARKAIRKSAAQSSKNEGEALKKERPKRKRKKPKNWIQS